MKKILNFLFLLLFSYASYGQYSHISLGKRKNIIWSKAISPNNLGSIYNYYYPIYFKNHENQGYTRTGMFGRKIKDDLNLNLPEVSKNFKNYKKNKRLSYILIPSTITSLCLWTYTSLSYMDRTGDHRLRAFYYPQHLPFLASYFACFYGSIYLNLKGDKDLKKAVIHHNKYLKNNETEWNQH